MLSMAVALPLAILPFVSLLGTLGWTAANRGLGETPERKVGVCRGFSLSELPTR